MSARFKKARDRAAATRRALAAFDDRKLTARAFLARAMMYAMTDEDQLEGLRITAFTDPALGPVEGFVQRVAREIVEPNWPSPPEDMGKLVRIYGSPEIEPLCAGHNFRGAEAAALGVRVATERWPDRFGSIEDPDEFALAEHDAKTEHAESLAALGVAWDASDVTIAEHGRGSTALATILFRGCDFGPVGDGWPALLAERDAQRKESAAAA